ncbi:PssD/Cps14F family polysaccharide biosynthesis glycosyltransferase [Clostridium sp. Marseille-P299]|uniref:PssD/Cps14F family polysaccharide biosynthesis glycosyltransferase n=1 Tax=Clostridium sp. Marseille-P299 TaxID=1805477 RepID=UPI001FA77BA2|nr:PssD/Cps14F family polysaccharide biosynthesis glycosyltransferase [Clostridium sp. Marseille-P299]
MQKKKYMDKKIKVCFAASTGGHYEQLVRLKPLMDRYNSFILTEKTNYNTEISDYKTYYLKQINRKEPLFILRFIEDIFLTLNIMRKEKPDVVISTGVLATIPICILAKLFRKKVIFIESFAMVTKATQSGKLLYRFSDRFYVQWSEMLNLFPNAIYKGGLY